MGGGDPAREIVGGLDGPLRPDPGLYLRIKPESYLRIATDEFVRKLTSEGSSALPLVDAIQAVQMIDMFFSRDRVLGLADGDLSWLRRAWTYHHAGHLGNPDPCWRYRVLMTIASALGVAPVPGAFPAADTSPALSPTDIRSWGYHGRHERGGQAQWHAWEGGWGRWHGRDGWGGHDWGGRFA